MADVDPEVATAMQPTKRTFKKFNFRGVDLDALLDSLLMSLSSSSLHVLAEGFRGVLRGNHGSHQEASQGKKGGSTWNQQQHSNWVLYSVVQEEFNVIPVQSQDITDMQEGEVVGREDDGSDLADGVESEDTKKLTHRSINATIVSAARTFVITKLLTIDQDYWQVSLHNLLCFWMCILILMFYGEYLIICVSFA
ncbi:hypothetical protein EZV62_019080 [Acer yangbiense]|uniref:Uncharacterized protein n=1 Tax=Acer yangbiense TaxID=1000413 RepID=A0A5C7HA60_9ROSI|nr:hypothetical protein EZV62_019080 [Acer yangbiense]